MKKYNIGLIFMLIFAIVLIPYTYSKYVTNENRSITINVTNPEYDVQFNSNPPSGKTATGSVAGVHFVYGDTKPLTKNEFKVRGYAFLGWTTNSSGTGTVYNDEQSVSNLTDRDGTIITLYAKWREKTNSQLKYNGERMMERMKVLSGSGSSYTTNNTTITAFKRAPENIYNAAVSSGATIEKISTDEAELETYMWFDSSTGTIYYYSEADELVIGGNSTVRMFARMNNISDLSGLTDFNMSSVTDSNRMFQECDSITDLSALADWDVSSVTDMTFMFGHSDTSKNMSITSLKPLANWDVSSVTSFYQTFKACKNLTSLEGLENWNVSSATNFQQMFNWNTSLADATQINGWAVDRTDNLSNMFNNNKGALTQGGTDNRPYFDALPGSWNNNGSYIPS